MPAGGGNFRHLFEEQTRAMSNHTMETSTGDDLLKNSTLYKEFQAEREEILRHKWIESEKAGYDIGFERALTDWIIKHRAKWRKGRQSPANPLGSEPAGGTGVEGG